MARQVKSKQRVADHGEVFTAEREVNAMLDLVRDETDDIEATFLEPACGDGNFLAEILRRKLHRVDYEAQALTRPGEGEPVRKKARYTDTWEEKSLIALSSIYGVELLPDNTAECRKRLLGIWQEAYAVACKGAEREAAQAIAAYILEKNIQCGDALSMTCENGGPILFTQWAWSRDARRGLTVQRTEHRFDVLLRENLDSDYYDDNNKVQAMYGGTAQLSMFGDADDFRNWQPPEELHGSPTERPCAEYETVHYLRIPEAKLIYSLKEGESYAR